MSNPLNSLPVNICPVCGRPDCSCVDSPDPRSFNHKPAQTPEQLLDHTAQLQHDFWDALSALESVLGVEIDENTDLNDETIETLTEERD